MTKKQFREVVELADATVSRAVRVGDSLEAIAAIRLLALRLALESERVQL